MQAPAFMAFRYVGQAVCGFECKFLEDFHSVFSSVGVWQAASLTA
jgi:hypothetical protein